MNNNAILEYAEKYYPGIIRNYKRGLITESEMIQCARQAIFENVLDRVVTYDMMRYIEKGWNDFFNNPLRYENTIVVDMVNLCLDEYLDELENEFWQDIDNEIEEEGLE